MIVNFFSPDDRYDDIYLSNYATIYVKDELLRVDGRVGHHLSGPARLQHSHLARPAEAGGAKHDGDRCGQRRSAARTSTPRPGSIGQPPAPAGQSFQLPIDTLGRLTDPERVRQHHREGRACRPMPAATARQAAVQCRDRPAAALAGSRPAAGTARPARWIDVGHDADHCRATTGGAATGGGATSTGGGTTAGGGATGGGGTTGGSATGGVDRHGRPHRGRRDSATPAMTGLSIAAESTRARS